MRHWIPAAGALVAATCSWSTVGQVVEPPFDANYVTVDLGSVTDLPAAYGGVTFKSGDVNTLLIGGLANAGTAAVYEVPVVRDCANHITGFAGPATLFASAPYIDGGLTYGPGGVIFYTTYSNNTLGQIKPGSTEPDKIIGLSALGIVGSTGTLRFIPPGYPHAGDLLIGSYSGSVWYRTSLIPDGDGTYDLGPVTTGPFTGGGPEGIVFIAAGNPSFAADSVLISEYSASRVAAYEIDPDGFPIVRTRRVVISGLFGAEGAVIDPLSGDFIFSTFGGGNRVIVVQGFQDPEPCDADFNEDDEVDAADLAILLSQWGDCPNCATDLTEDCVVGPSDLAVMLSLWGDC